MKSIQLIAGLFILLLVLSCDKNKQANEKDIKVTDLTQEVRQQSPFPEVNKEGEFDNDTVRNGKQLKQAPPPNGRLVQDEWDKKIIKNASLNLDVKDHKTYYAFLRDKVRSLGGYISQEEQNQSSYQVANTLSIKIPVDQFDNAIVLLTSNVEKVNEKKISSQDVTVEMLDVKSRMESKKQVRLRYLDLLKQAKNMEEILSVQSEINTVQEEIESATGRISFLGHSASFSTINLVYQQVLNPMAKDDDKPSFLTELSRAFRSGWLWIGSLLVGLTTIWPLFLVLLVILFFYKRIRKNKARLSL